MDEVNVRKWLIRAWGNAKIGYEQNELPYHVMKDLDNLAYAFGLTESDKEYAIHLMDGDVYTVHKETW